MSPYNKNRRNIICGLDIGTTKVAFLMAAVNRNGIEIIGAGTVPNQGVRHGVVVNIDQTTDAIRRAREEAELMSGMRAEKVWVCVGGTHLESFDSSGMVAIRNDEVSEDDINRVIEVAKAVALPSDRQVIHVLPKEFKIDGQMGISDPIGMSGVRLECDVHIVTANKATIQNVVKCIEKVGLGIAGFTLQQLASGLSVLSEDEKQLGVSVVDIGGGTSDIIVYQRGSVVHTATVPIGGFNFTQDIAMGLRTTQLNAETLKLTYGCAIQEMINAEETIEVESVGGREPRNVPRSSLCNIVEARAEEMLKLIFDNLSNKGFVGKLGSGVVLTGGASELTGLLEMSEFIFDMPTRAGRPKKMGGLTDIVKNARYATALGLILYGYEQEKAHLVDFDEADPVSEKVNELGRRIKNFFARSL